MRMISLLALVAVFSLGGARVWAQEPTSTPTPGASATPVAPTTAIPPVVEGPPTPTNLRLFILGSFARLEWGFQPRPHEGPAQGFNLLVTSDGATAAEFVVGGDVRAFDFPAQYLPRCGGPRFTFGVSAFVAAGGSDYAEDEVLFGTDCDVSIDDPALAILPTVVPDDRAPVKLPDAGSGHVAHGEEAGAVSVGMALAAVVAIALAVHRLRSTWMRRL